MNSDFFARLRRYRGLYIFVLPCIIYYFVYRYYPIICQFVLSFKDYRIQTGIWGSKWVGFANYRDLFTTPETLRIIKNTVVISMLRFAFGFAPPIILAIMLFDMTSSTYRRLCQSILYIPHFFSWVVIYGIFQALLSSTGYVNNILESIGMKRMDFLMDAKFFYPLLIGSALWKEIGWGTIIYLAALTSIDPQLFEAARLDGVNPVQKIWYITLPGIMPVVGFTLTLALSGLFTAAGTEQILLFYSPLTYSVGDVIGTWVYRRGLGNLKYSLASTIDQLNSVIGFLMVVIFNNIARKRLGVSIW
jgi:putative aldouronate transport system permease protein